MTVRTPCPRCQPERVQAFRVYSGQAGPVTPLTEAERVARYGKPSGQVWYPHVKDGGQA